MNHAIHCLASVDLEFAQPNYLRYVTTTETALVPHTQERAEHFLYPALLH